MSDEQSFSSGGSKQVQCSVQVAGQTLPAQTTFNVVRPTISVQGWTNSVGIGHDSRNNTFLCFGVSDPITASGIMLTNYLTMPPGANYNNGDTNYSTEWVQLITSNPETITISNSPSDVVVHSCTTAGTVLDGSYPYKSASENA